MPPESTKTKRKSLDRKVKTSEDAPPAKKAKTTTTEPPSPKPEKVKAAAEARKNRKRAADFIDSAEVEVEVEKAELAPKRSKKQKVVAPVEEPAEKTIAAPKTKKTRVEKKVKKTEEVIDAPEPAEEKPVKSKKGKNAEKIDAAPAEIAELIEEKSKNAKKEKVGKKNKKAEEVIDPIEAVEEKPVKEKKTKAEKKGGKAAAESVEIAKVTDETTAGASTSKKSKVEKRGKEAAEPVAQLLEETTTVETVKAKKGKAAKKEAAPIEVTEETAVAETVKPKKAKAEKATKKVVEVTEEAEVVPKSILKKVKKTSKPTEEAEVVPTSIMNAKKAKKGKTDDESKELISADALEDAFDGFSSGEEDNIADQTAALLAGFDSTDESEAGDDEGIPLDMISKVKLDKAAKKALAAAKKDADDAPGTIYVGRIPHGFYEHQMKAYFTQFGDVTHLRLARNKKTGASKHYAFVEFSSQEVAEIVARTMNNYLMFGHIMKLRLMTPEQVHKDLWKGAGKRFKVIPRAKLAARDLAQPKGRDYWRKRIESEEKVRAEKMEKLKELGYQFEMPAIRKVEDVAMKGTDEAVAGAEEVVVDEPVKAIEPTSAVVVGDVEKEVMSLIAKKKAKGKGSEIIGDAVRVTKKTKKEKKVKA